MKHEQFRFMNNNAERILINSNLPPCLYAGRALFWLHEKTTPYRRHSIGRYIVQKVLPMHYYHYHSRLYQFYLNTRDVQAE